VSPDDAIRFIRQAISMMIAQIVKLASKLTRVTVIPPQSEPREMPKKSALLFQARTVPRSFGNSLTRPACWAGKNNWATAELIPRAGPTSVPASKAARNIRKQTQRPARLAPVMNLTPTRSAT